MNPASLIPLAEPIPVPWPWFDALLVITFAAHILFMNSMLGSAAIGLVHAFKGKEGLTRDIGQKLPPLLALTINLGVAPLLFLQVNYGQFDYVSSVLMGGWWLCVIPVLILSYYGLYAYKFAYDSMSRPRRLAIFSLSVGGLLYVGFMLSNNMTIMLRPEIWSRYFEGHTAFLNWGDPAIYPRFLHFMVGTVAIGGVFIALLGHWRKQEEYVAIGLTWFIRATIVNIAIGLWFLMALPGNMMLNFMGQTLPATATFVAALASAALMLWAAIRKKTTQTAVWAATTVLFMSFTRHWVRTLYLEPWFRIETTPITHQYGSLYLFIGFLVVGLALIGYMLKLYFKSRGGEA
ncbi:hypothetical protein [Pseudodesulfovibrio piezophilus]|uniref:Polysulphide reductase NrfD n=1 Tax=Pseudodesulfovibrio piezophilus (strain DSM 21447 / JCM 15486 / C1TLV30) TaxID=1322246 RepID=M1WQM7_PSEP2|nr:hypothetical protein [Pseudodesulfovibrio piezophilus]CCH49059.1 conserved membrane protein of unknown function [Pseudodesulfovibrio piezophilus C1TLV30]